MMNNNDPNWTQILTVVFTGVTMLAMLYITVSLIQLQNAINQAMGY